jgi:hypothetical protein
MHKVGLKFHKCPDLSGRKAHLRPKKCNRDVKEKVVTAKKVQVSRRKSLQTTNKVRKSGISEPIVLLERVRTVSGRKKISQSSTSLLRTRKKRQKTEDVQGTSDSGASNSRKGRKYRRGQTQDKRRQAGVTGLKRKLTKVTGRNNTPTVIRRNRTPSVTGRNSSPSVTGPNRTPTVTEHNRTVRGRNRTPIVSGRNRSPSITGSNRSLAVTGRSRKTTVTVRNRTPKRVAKTKKFYSNVKDAEPETPEPSAGADTVPKSTNTGPKPKKGVARNVAKSAETGEGGHVCLICGRKWKYAHMLTIHMTSHSNERKFKCNICGATYKWIANLQRHQTKAHKKD